ncbi:hypothetical protein CEUSTIGMA_g8344.t1 [Chlamydomonas eustigma]|uniref:HECT domain-containing protein n=1 Tax=Chlamydomonas eustigma TaxID=1157962 RepID=A0A250XDC7_9CHLO|nr:hypothetical protein CEUSTIGMA_g8344.t1 [Chlamydomonas eustigma]|eukprot:GAX80909.1 hypothetical protein CEUSTIGMA_g8344.t1 [Chlamydomonas eustigma]
MQPGPATPFVYKPPPTPSLNNIKRTSVLVYAWGRGDMGQLGISSDTFISVPTKVEQLQGKDIVHVASSAFNSIFLTDDGEVYTCGSNDSGQLGVKLIHQLKEDAPTARDDNHAAMSDAELKTSSWGFTSVPVRVMALDLYKIQHASSGQTHMLVVTEQGQLASWGASEFGQLGQGGEGLSHHQPRILKTCNNIHSSKGPQAGDHVRYIRSSSGACHNAVLDSYGHLHTFGQGTFGALGQGDEDNRDTPCLVKQLWPVGITMVTCGENHTCALSLDGRVFTWGRGKYGQLGHGDFGSRSCPELVKALLGSSIIQIACGGDHTLAVSNEGVLYSWGRGTWGQCGNGTLDNTCRPGRVQGLIDYRVLQASAGLRHSLVLTSTNDVYSFGDGEQGQLGTTTRGGGSTTAAAGGVVSCQSTPAKVLGLPTLPILFIVAGGDHSLVVLGEPAPGQRIPIGPESARIHGRGVVPVQPLPSGLIELCAACASSVGATESTSSATASAVSSTNTMPPAGLPGLVSCIEDLFSSPGYLSSGFALPEAQNPPASAAAAAPISGGATPSSSVAAGAGFAAARSLAAASGTASNILSSSATVVGHGTAAEFSSLMSITHNIDTQAVQSVYQAILKVYQTEVVSALGSSCLRLLQGIEQHLKWSALRAAEGNTAMSMTAQLEWLLPLLLILFLNPLNGEHLPVGTSLMTHLVDVYLTLPSRAQQLLALWLSRLPIEQFGGRVVRPLQRYLSGLASQGFTSRRGKIMRGVQILDYLFDANHYLGSPIPLSEFHNRTISETANLKDEYLMFAELKNSSRSNYAVGAGMEAPTCLCQVPFLLTPEAKSRILQGEATVQKHHVMQNSAMAALMQGLHPAAIGSVAFLDIHVRRSHILQDSLQQIVSRPQDLKKPLRVTFISNGVPEEGLDEGGVSREFFQLLVAEIFRPDYGMFIYNEETRTFWFNAASLESTVEFQLVGIVMGLAIYNGIILDVHFPLVVYKKLLGQHPTLADLAEAQPSLAKGLQQLLDFEGDVENTFCRTFDVEYEYYGVMKKQDLLPGGSNIPVTALNRQEYVKLYTEWQLTSSIEKQFNAFAHGFHLVCGGLALSLFRYDELELLVCGLPHLDFHELEKNAKYEGYTRDSPTVNFFWQAVHSMTMEQKRKLLAFTTGCDRAPVGGLGQLTLIVQRGGPDTDRLPTSHTCFNTLLLPEYSSKEKLNERLALAIENAQGFGLR